MGNPYPANFEDRDGTIRLQGQVDFTDSGNQPGGSIPSGAGTPAGAVTPSGIGALYVDTTNGALYIASGVTSADWVGVGGVVASLGEVPGVVQRTGELLFVGGADRDTPLNGTGAGITDAYAQWNGNSAGLYFNGNGTDGQQSLTWSNDAGGFTLITSAGTLTGGPGGIRFPSTDPHIVGVWWDNNGVLTKSTG